MVFVLLYVPCIAAMGMFYKEAQSRKWFLVYFSYSMVIAWIMAFLAYRLALIFS